MVKTEANGVGSEYFGGRIPRVLEFQKRIVGLCLAESRSYRRRTPHSLTGKVCELRLPGLKAMLKLLILDLFSHMERII